MGPPGEVIAELAEEFSLSPTAAPQSTAAVDSSTQYRRSLANITPEHPDPNAGVTDADTRQFHASYISG